jgi:hypothetical protein
MMKTPFFTALAAFVLGCTGEPAPALHAPDGKVEPHPAGAVRAEIAETHALVQELMNALSAREVARAKALIGEHARRFDDAEEREGFGAIARCLEQPGPESRRAGERYLLEHRASPLRRKVRHACLGARAPALLR